MTVMRGPQKKRDHRIEAVDAVNRGYLQIIREFHGVTEADINPVLEHAPGDPRKDYYRSDGLHLNERGYAEMVKVVRPRVEEAYREFKKREEEGGR